MGNPHAEFRLEPDAYLEWESRQPEKHEYLNGEVYAMVGARDAHVTTAGNLFALVREHLRGGPCRAYISDMKLRVEAANAFFYPDVFVTCDPRDRGSDLFKSYPVLIAEVLSEATAAFDRGRKFRAYRTIETLQEYLLLDADAFNVDCFRRDSSGRWVLHAFEDDATLDLSSIAFKVKLEALFEDVARASEESA